ENLRQSIQNPADAVEIPCAVRSLLTKIFWIESDNPKGYMAVFIVVGIFRDNSPAGAVAVCRESVLYEPRFDGSLIRWIDASAVCGQRPRAALGLGTAWPTHPLVFAGID